MGQLESSIVVDPSLEDGSALWTFTGDSLRFNAGDAAFHGAWVAAVNAVSPTNSGTAEQVLSDVDAGLSHTIAFKSQGALAGGTAIFELEENGVVTTSLDFSADVGVAPNYGETSITTFTPTVPNPTVRWTVNRIGAGQAIYFLDFIVMVRTGLRHPENFKGPIVKQRSFVDPVSGMMAFERDLYVDTPRRGGLNRRVQDVDAPGRDETPFPYVVDRELPEP